METKVKKPERTPERLKTLGCRVYKKHRKMIKEIAKNKHITNGEVVRIAIEKFYELESKLA